MDKNELLTMYNSLERVLGKGKTSKKVNASNISILMPCLLDILSSPEEKELAARLQSIFAEHKKHVAERIIRSRQTTLDALFDQDPE